MCEWHDLSNVPRQVAIVVISPTGKSLQSIMAKDNTQTYASAMSSKLAQFEVCGYMQACNMDIWRVCAAH